MAYTREELIEFIKNYLQCDGDDSLERAESAFRRLFPDETRTEYGLSGKTRQEILDRYRERRKKKEAAIAYLETLSATPEVRREEKSYPQNIGPWMASWNGFFWEVRDNSDGSNNPYNPSICSFHGQEAATLANIQLVVSAPLLLDALYPFARAYQGGVTKPDDYRAAYEAVMEATRARTPAQTATQTTATAASLAEKGNDSLPSTDTPKIQEEESTQTKEQIS